MKRSSSLVIALLATAFAVPAVAGNNLNLWTRPASTIEAPKIVTAAERTRNVTKPVVRDGFEEIGGDAGWQLSQHRYVLKDGKFAHGDECDHVIRSASAVSAADIERNRVQSPGS
jgi:hypothetical protein